MDKNKTKKFTPQDHVDMGTLHLKARRPGFTLASQFMLGLLSKKKDI